MKFVGIRRVFSTKNEEQYETIGAFWDEMSNIYVKSARMLEKQGKTEIIPDKLGVKNPNLMDSFMDMRNILDIKTN